MMVSSVDAYMAEGCGRCDYYATPACKVRRWTELLETLRQVLLDSGLTETVKWGSPCYVDNAHNICMIGALKSHCTLSFFKGAVLADPDGWLEFAGENSRIAKFMRFTSAAEVLARQEIIHGFIRQAVAVEQQGISGKPAEEPLVLPAELLDMMAEDQVLEKAFYSLTPGRQRGYVLFFLQAKQSATRRSRIEKYREKILGGKGMHD
jgi:uncharacterized protein YdeI (YjbR/CyaY-like superfamily)